MTIYKTVKTILKQKPKSITIKGCNNPNVSDTINEKVTKEDYLDMMKRFTKYCESHHQYPSYIITKKSKIKVSFKLFSFCVGKIEKFIKNNGYLPKYCIFNKADTKNTKKTCQNAKKSTTTPISNHTNTYISSPHLTTTAQGLGQNYPWDCSCAAMQQCLYKLSGKVIKEDTLIKVGGVGTKGVGHDGINTMVAWFNKKYGTNYKIQWKNFSDLGKTRDARFLALGKLMAKPNVAVLTHIGYANSGKSKITSNSKIFGHYEVLSKISMDKKTCVALNSLGKKINANAYAGHLQTRTFEIQASFFANTPKSQAAIAIITK